MTTVAWSSNSYDISQAFDFPTIVAVDAAHAALAWKQTMRPLGVDTAHYRVTVFGLNNMNVTGELELFSQSLLSGGQVAIRDTNHQEIQVIQLSPGVLLVATTWSTGAGTNLMTVTRALWLVSVVGGVPSVTATWSQVDNVVSPANEPTSLGLVRLDSTHAMLAYDDAANGHSSNGSLRLITIAGATITVDPGIYLLGLFAESPNFNATAPAMTSLGNGSAYVAGGLLPATGYVAQQSGSSISANAASFTFPGSFSFSQTGIATGQGTAILPYALGVTTAPALVSVAGATLTLASVYPTSDSGISAASTGLSRAGMDVYVAQGSTLLAVYGDAANPQAIAVLPGTTVLPARSVVPVSSFNVALAGSTLFVADFDNDVVYSGVVSLASQRQFPRSDGLGMSTSRSIPPPTSVQFGSRAQPKESYL